MPDASTILSAQLLLWCVLIIMAIVVVMLLGRVRDFYRRIAPLGALAPTHAAAAHLDATSLVTLAGTPVSVGGHQATGKNQLLLFVSGDCPVSRKMAPITMEFARRERIALLFCGDDTPDAQQSALTRLGIGADLFVNDSVIGRRLGVDRVPFAVLLDGSGAVIARGLVNSLEHLESLIAVRETGYSSLQSFVDANPAALSA